MTLYPQREQHKTYTFIDLECAYFIIAFPQERKRSLLQYPQLSKFAVKAVVAI